jgi:hypothetical protein
MTRSLLLLACVLGPALAQDGHQFSRFGEGDGPALADGVLKLLDAAKNKRQSNAVAFDRAQPGAFETTTLACKLRVLEGGDGGAFVFLNTAAYAARGPAPFARSWVEPNFEKTFAVGIDVHNPKNEEMFSAWGNYRGMPQREISLHWDGREIVKRLATEEFRGDWADVTITLQHVVGGADVTVQVGPAKVYDKYFVPGLLPYESRLAIGAGTRADATTEFDVKDIRYERAQPAKGRRPAKRVEVFNHVLTDNSKTEFEREVDLPPLGWEFARIVLTLDIHDAGPNWDEWDRNAYVAVYDKDGKKHDIVPFITSYRTECHWKVDVTHFRPWLHGKTKFEVRGGTKFYKNRGYMMSVHLDYYHGKPALEAYEIVPLWEGVAKYKSAENHFKDFFEPREVAIGADAKAVRLWSTTTGHSQIGEFVPSRRTIVCNGQRFANTLWKDDVYLNPNRPQFGTWKFSRAGWAPGDIVWPWWIDLTAHIKPGATAKLSYEPQPYDFGDTPKPPAQKEINKASHSVRAYLIQYREPGETRPAPTLMIRNVQQPSNASRAGIKRGDYLAEYDGKVVNSIKELQAAARAAAQPGREKVPVVIFRGPERLELELPPGKLGISLSER